MAELLAENWTTLLVIAFLCVVFAAFAQILNLKKLKTTQNFSMKLAVATIISMLIGAAGGVVGVLGFILSLSAELK